MATETTTDIYRLDAADAETTYKHLAELAASLTAGLQLQVEQSTHVAGALTAVADASKKAEAASLDHARGLRTVTDETKKNRESVEGLSHFMKEEWTKNIASTAAQYELLRMGLEKVVEFGKESLAAAREQEKAELALTNALKTAGYGAAGLTSSFTGLASSLQHTTGVQDEAIQGVITLLLQMGVAPGKIEKVTSAVLDYAAATGKDAHTATVTLMRALDGESEEMRGLGVTIERTGDKMEDLDRLTEAVSNRFDGAAKTSMEGMTGRVHAFELAWDDLKKAVGGALAEIATSSAATAAIERMTEIIALKKTIEKNTDQEMKNKEIESLTESYVVSKKAVADLRREIDAGEVPAAFLESAKKEVLDLEKNADELEIKIKKLRGIIGERQPEVMVLEETDIESDYEKRKHFADEMLKVYEHNAEEWKKYLKGFSEVDAHGEEADKKEFDEEILYSQKRFDLRKKENEELANLAAETVSIVTKELDDEEKANQAFFQEMFKEVSGYAQQLLKFELASVADSLQVNSAYNAKLREKSIERRQMELAEQGVIRSRGDVEQEAAQEEDAANKKKLASLLATIAQEAIAKAAFFTAEAIGYAAGENYPGAAKATAAAAEFAAVAATIGVAAGVASYAISQSRGETADERSALEAFDRKKGDASSARDARQSGQSGAGATGEGGVQISVYNIGITGQTRTAQARELEKIQKEYAKLNVGGGVF